MDMTSDATWWWIASGVLVAIELATGTFYLLMLALGTTAAALVAHMGGGASAQMMGAALVGGGAVAAWHARRRRLPPSAPAQANRDVNLDIGERVHVTHWDADGSARVQYRGTQWRVRHVGQGIPDPGHFVIQSLNGSELEVVRAD